MAEGSRARHKNTSVPPPVKVLLVDDEADSLLPVLAQNVGPLGFQFIKEPLPNRALESIEKVKPEAVLLDLHFPGDERREDGRTTGGELLAAVRRQFNTVPVVIFTSRLDDADIPLETFEEQPHARFAKSAFGRDRTWIAALADALNGAIDAARFSLEEITVDLGFLVGRTKEMREAAALIRTAARNTLNVLIYGESGTGKRSAAEAIHKLSGRKGRFEELNCRGIAEEILEAKLFGCNGTAQHATEGLFEHADGGTLFLDGIQHVPIALQNKLVLVSRKRAVRRLGETVDTPVDVRLIAATDHSLAELVADGLLCEDLAYQFSMIVISLLPLRQRTIDFSELFEVFVEKANEAHHTHVMPNGRRDTLEKLAGYSWPGNIREFESTITRAVVTKNSNVLTPEDIVFAELTPPPPPPPPPLPDPVALLTDKLEALPVDGRYGFLLNQTDGELRRAVLCEFVCRLRRRIGRKVKHKMLASELDTLANGQKDFERIRQFVNSCVKLTQLECNQ